MALASVAPNNHQLTLPHGQPTFIFGVTYHGYFDRVWRMWGSDWFDIELIKRDFRKAQQSGFNTIRLMVDDTLAAELQQKQFKKLDQLLDQADAHELTVILTLNEAHNRDLEAVLRLDGQLGQRYADRETILAFDLEREPTFYNIAAAVYPTGHEPALQTSALLDHYGASIAREAVADLQRRRHLPAHLDEVVAHHYANGLRLLQQLTAAIETYENEGRGSLFDFIISDEAAYWHPVITALQQTLDLWLNLRTNALRQAGSQHLLTVSWSQRLLALLPANQQLDFQSYQQAVPLSLVGFNTYPTHFDDLRRAFPDQPLLLSEFGWSNQPEANTTALTALYEGATLAYLRANGLAGGCKAMLNDFQDESSGQAALQGVFAVGDEAKPIAHLVERFAQEWPSIDQPALYFSAIRDVESGLTYRFDLPQQLIVGGHTYQDNAISWQADGLTGHCFIKRDLEQLIIETDSAGQLAIDPWRLVPIWNRAREANVYRVYSETSRTRQDIFAAGNTVSITTRPGAQYLIKMGFEDATTAASGVPQFEPKAGEHVLLIANAETYLGAALKYIRRFAPDLSFTPNDVAGRWAYISVVATAAEIPEELLEEWQSLGSMVVERVIGSDAEQTATLLDRMAHQNQRFLSIANLPLDSSTTPPETYIVQPGDTLSTIAESVYGNFQVGHLIYEANQDQIIDPQRIRVGTELRLPMVG